MARLLPKHGADFSDSNYWERFFNTRSSSFEWYGDFIQHSSFFAKYVKKSDNVLVVGCGNSTLGASLRRQLHCRSVMNIDNNETVIAKMRNLSVGTDEDLRYECIDALTLEDYVKTKNLEQFTCIIDKGTLDAIHTGEDSEERVKRLFENLSHSLSLMGRYIVITLAQSHIVESLCKYFVTGSNEWIVNCHVLNNPSSETLNASGEGAKFPLPVFGFVFTKLRPCTTLPRIFLYRFNSTEPRSLEHKGGDPAELARLLSTWIVEEQSDSVARYEYNSTGTVSCRFTCPATGLTVFYCQLTRMSKSIRKSRDSNPPRSRCVGAVFLIPFGHNNRACFTEEPGRLRICESLGFDSILFVFVNPRYYFPNLEAVKTELSAVVGPFLNRVFGNTDSGPPILSTPDAYDHQQLSTLDSIVFGDNLVVECVNVDSCAVNIRRLISVDCAMRPVLTSNALAANLDSALSPREIHVASLLALFRRSRVNEASQLFIGLPLWENAAHSMDRLHVIPLGLPKICPVKAILDYLYSPISCQHVREENILQCPASLSDLSADEPYDAVFYDPVSIDRTQYHSYFCTEQLKIVKDMCGKILKPTGYLIVATEESSNAEVSIIRECLTESNVLKCVAVYTVPDPEMSDPPTTILIFSPKAPSNMLCDLLNEASNDTQAKNKRFTEAYQVIRSALEH